MKMYVGIRFVIDYSYLVPSYNCIITNVRPGDRNSNIKYIKYTNLYNNILLYTYTYNMRSIGDNNAVKIRVRRDEVKLYCLIPN